jgi:hypothetical protein
MEINWKPCIEHLQNNADGALQIFISNYEIVKTN